MAKQFFTQLAHTYREGSDIGGKWISEKLDGIHAIWDGGISRGRIVPWNVTDRPCTGLWTRYAHPIHAPDWFVDRLPKGVPLSGELWGQFENEKIKSIVSRHNADERWAEIRFMCYGLLGYDTLLMDRRIDTPLFKLEMSGCREFVEGFLPRYLNHDIPVMGQMSLRGQYHWLKKLEYGENFELVPQHEIPTGQDQAREFVEEFLRLVYGRGGEGAMVCDPTHIWRPERCREIIKIKSVDFDEGTVIGYTDGKGKYEGMIGALVVEFDGPKGKVTFNLSGMTDEERSSQDHFPIGSKIRFKYRELSVAGVPKEARYVRGK